LEGNGWGCLQYALEFLDKVIGIEERHAAQKHVDAAAAALTLGSESDIR
jgi:hypothetical protein